MAGSLAEALNEARAGMDCCANCRFWRSREGYMKGSCHRFPPQVVQGTAMPPKDAPPHWRQRPEHYFPMSMNDQWCGEYEKGE